LQVKEFFDQYWGARSLRRFDRYYDFLRIATDDLFRKLETKQWQRVLVIGLGNSDDIHLFGSLKAQIIAVDISFHGLRYVKDFVRIQMDGNCLGFKRGSFDMVFLRTVMLHCEHRRVLREIGRVLRKDGYFFWIEPLKNNPLLWLYRCMISPGRLTLSDYLDYDELDGFRAIFEDVWHRECFFFTVVLLPVFLLAPALRRIVRSLQRAEMRIINAVPWFRRWCWISYGYARGRGC
jgi:SAM-dependent methyltransferase